MFMLQFEAFKEPRGFMKILIILFAILAFSTTCGFNSNLKVAIECENQGNITGKTREFNFSVAYPFDSEVFRFPATNCSDSGAVLAISDNPTKARFFVAIGVIAFLYALGILVVYVVFTDLYASKSTYPLVDFTMTSVIVFLYFVASIAWATGVTNVKSSTSQGVFDELRQSSGREKDFHFVVNQPSFSTLTVSLICGFFSVALWIANAWFVFKETEFHREQALPNQEQPPNQVVP